MTNVDVWPNKRPRLVAAAAAAAAATAAIAPDACKAVASKAADRAEPVTDEPDIGMG